MTACYHVYGLTVASSRDLPYITIADTADEVDVQVTFIDDLPSQLKLDGFFHFWDLPDGGLGFHVRLTQGTVEFLIAPDGSSIQVTHSVEAPLLEIMRYLMGVAFGSALRFMGVLVLHASAVMIDGSAVLFTGKSRAGKSTLSAAFDRRGYSLISEDVLAVDITDQHACVRPGYAGVRLYPDTLNHLYGVGAVEAALPVENKLLQPLDSVPDTSLPIGAIYLLAPRNPNLSQPKISEVNKKDALFALTNNLYMNNYVGWRWLNRDFPRLGELMQRTPIYLLERTDNLADLDVTIDLILR